MISEELEKYTCEHSHFEKKRDYISLSHIWLTPEEIINSYKNGFQDSVNIRLKCYKGYQMEVDLFLRLKVLFNIRIESGVEISLHNGLIKGHPDFMFDDYPGDCKSVLMDEWLPVDNKVPKRIYWQMQAYMKFMNKTKSLLIFESRETGRIKDIWLNANQKVQNEIEVKINQIINLLK